MKIIETEIPEVKIIEPDVFGDHRGWFMESYSKKKFADLGIDCNFVQDNHSFSAEKGTLRGIHFQINPMSQAKLTRCTVGAVMDIIVDLRKNSPTYKKWLKIELSAENKRLAFAPRGFGHGFVTLTENVNFQYKVDEYYSAEFDRSIRFDDKEIGIDWGIADPILSDKDKNAPLLKDSDINFE